MLGQLKVIMLSKSYLKMLFFILTEKIIRCFLIVLLLSGKKLEKIYVQLKGFFGTLSNSWILINFLAGF